MVLLALVGFTEAMILLMFYVVIGVIKKLQRLVIRFDTIIERDLLTPSWMYRYRSSLISQ